MFRSFDPPIYGGVSEDCSRMVKPDNAAEVVFRIWDLPFSFVADTLFLPDDLWNWPPPDPLVGWTYRTFDDYASRGDRHHYELPKAVTEDYHAFIKRKNLSVLDIMIMGFYEDGTGKHAVKFDSPEGGIWVNYVLIYNQKNERIKVVKTRTGRYAC